MTADVVVVGGGPAGLYAAQRLARAGLRVRVLEEHARVGDPVHCTGILGAEAFTLPGVPREAVLAWPSAGRFHSPAGHCVTYAGGAGEVCVVDRGAFDRALAAAAVGAGAEVTTGARVVNIRVEGDGVIAETRAAGDGRPRAISARMCLLACGARYGFQQRLGWGRPPLLLSAAQTEVRAAEADGLDVFFRPELAPTGFAWLVPIRRDGENRAKVGLMGGRRPRGDLGRVLGDLARAGRIRSIGAPVVTRPLPLGPLGRTYGERILAIGDAAGLVKPTTGGGIYYGLLSATWAADAVVAAFGRGDFSAGMLAGYEETWRARLGPELRAGVCFRWLAARLTAADLDALAVLAISDGLMPVIRATARFNWHRELIVRTLRHPGVLGIVLRRLLMTGQA